MLKTLVIGLSLVVGSTLLSNEEESSDPFVQELNALDWQTTGTHKLPSSHSSLAIPSERGLVKGKDAAKLSKLFGNEEDSSLEAIVVDESINNVVFFSNNAEGYISIDDWEELDPSELLNAVRENTESANSERRKNGFDPMHIVGWVQEPTLDSSTNTVYWAIEHQVENSEENGFNSVALRLGRNGYEKLIWIGEMSAYKASGGELDVMLKAHQFDPGYAYSDYVSGDALAGYGIASLVAATAGAKAIKAGIFGVLFKKIVGFVFAGFAYLLYKFKSLFKRKQVVNPS